MPRGVYPRQPRRNLAPATQVLAPEETVTTSSLSGGEVRISVCLWPAFADEDKGDGGVRRVVEGQRKHLSEFGIDLVGTPEEADLIACHIEMPPPWYKLYPDKPLVAHCHGLYWDNFEWDAWALDANAKVMNLLKTADAITAPSEWVAHAVERNTSRQVDVIPHGIDIDDWQPAENAGYILWNKTRPDPVCDPEPVNQVAKLMPQVEFVSTFGDQSIPNLTVTGRLSFDEAKKLIQRAGVYLVTSKETFGIGTLEAMACGVPIVGFQWGGQVEIIRQNQDGFLVTPGDTHSLVLAIEGALRDRQMLSVYARQRAAQFSWQRAAELYAQVYRRVLTQHQSRSPRVSVIVTAYNLEKYLPDCLDSVLKQSDEDWECIIVDDASPDRCGQIADVYAQHNARFKVIHNEQNAYLAEARNIGIRQARGRYILPLDADDMLAPKTIEELADALDKDRTVHVAYGKVKFVNEDGRTPTIYDGFRETPGYSSWPYQFSFEQQIKQRNLLPYCSMFRRKAWQDSGGYSPRCRTAEDATFWTKLSSYGFRPSMVTQETTLIYRNREGSMSREEGQVEWVRWFPWARQEKSRPSAASTASSLTIPSFDRPLISVIIPVGPHHRRLVKDAVESVDAQSFRNWECIVANDSGAPLNELPTWVHIIDLPPPGVGVAAARNAAIRAAKAPLFLPLDADDYLQPNALQWLLEAYRETRDIIYSDFWEDPRAPGDFKVYELKDYSAQNLTRGTIHCVTALTPKSAWETVGGYDESLPAWEDWDFQLKCADVGICSRRIASPLWVYRKHTGLRRNDNVRDFETSKNGILSKWNAVWEGRKTLMACSSCASRSTIRPSQPTALSQEQQVARAIGSNGDEAILVQYVGERRGNMPYKGKSGTFYRFSSHGSQSYVLARDIATFQNRDDFRILTQPNRNYREESPTPLLIAEGNLA